MDLSMTKYFSFYLLTRICEQSSSYAKFSGSIECYMHVASFIIMQEKYKNTY